MRHLKFILYLACTVVGFVTPEAVADKSMQRLEYLIEEIKSKTSNSESITNIKRELLKRSNVNRLSAFTEIIKPHVQDVEASNVDALIFSKLDLTDAECDAALASKKLRPLAMATFGDVKSQAHFINKAIDATRIPSIRKTYGDLFFIGTESAKKTIMDAMQSDEVYYDVHGNAASKALLMIQLFGEYHPDQAKFQKSQYMKHANVSTEAFQGEVHQEYLRQLEQEINLIWGQKIEIRPPLLLTDNIIGERLELVQP